MGQVSIKDYASLKHENAQLRQQELLLSQKLQKFEAVSMENQRLRGLLLSSNRIDADVLIAEIIGVDHDPFRHEVVLDRGAADSVAIGQAVLDKDGLMGQIIHVGPFSSRALLITDKSHATPVNVNRNGIRAIAVGAGSLDRLDLIHVPDTVDLKVGDLLVSSGLGGRFPAGYPVGYITYIENDPGQPFAMVQARPASHLDRQLHVMIIQPRHQSAGQLSEAAATQEPNPALPKDAFSCVES